MGENSNRVTVIVAVIGVVGVLGAALIGNWKSIFPNEGNYITPTAGVFGLTPTESSDTSPASVLIDDADPRVRYSEGGGWKTDADYHLLKSTQHWTNNAGSTAVLDFEGDWIEVNYYKEPGGAVWSVDIDGKFKEPIDCGSQSGKNEYQRTRKFTGLGLGSHRITLTHTGNPTDGRPPRTIGDYTVNLDGFVVAIKD